MNPYDSSPELRKTLILRMDDMGTREEHCNDLLDIWSAGLGILMARSYLNRPHNELEMIKQLTYATELLKKHMTVVTGPYKEDFYRNLIDNLPKAQDIKDE